MSNPVEDNAGEYMELIDEPIDTTGSGHLAQASGFPAEKEVKPEPKTKEPAVDPKADQSRFEYWQSQHDKVAKERDQLKSLEPLQRLIAEREDVRQTIENAIMGKPAPEQRPHKEELVKPVRPTKPADYDTVSAQTDPESPSFKYRAALELYDDQMREFYEKREEMRQQEFDRARIEAQRKEQAAIADAMMRKRLTERGIIGDEQTRFFETMDTPKSFELDNLITLYEVVQGKHQPTPEALDAKQKALEEQIRRSGAPLPASVEGRVALPVEKELTEEDNFNQSLLASGKAWMGKRWAKP